MDQILGACHFGFGTETGRVSVIVLNMEGAEQPDAAGLSEIASEMRHQASVSGSYLTFDVGKFHVVLDRPYRMSAAEALSGAADRIESMVS